MDRGKPLRKEKASQQNSTSPNNRWSFSFQEFQHLVLAVTNDFAAAVRRRRKPRRDITFFQFKFDFPGHN
jgi:hypothetical protein